jgi:class 3 adenylate cyclase
MKCPKCQHENEVDAKFCNKCGSKLEMLCPECGIANLPGSQFCKECGHNLIQPSEPAPKELSFDEKIEKIQKYLPKGLTDKILSQRDKIEGERKQVTVMFCDLEGFTPLVDKIGAEEAYSIMNQVYEILIHKVHDYEGTVNEMKGDGIIALYGAPIALEDAPQRAIRSAYSIHREMSRFSDKIKQEREGIQHLKMRIGIHTGPVVVGALGNDLRVEFKVVGDTVNLVDSLPEGAKGVLQAGSTIEREFDYELIRKVTALSEKELLSNLSILKDSELLYERGIYPQSTYVFKHALTQEVVYDSILNKRKKELHHKIADAMEETYKDRLDEHYESLAEHYITSENLEKGAEYCRLASRKAYKTTSLYDAIAYGEKWVDCLERLPLNEDLEKDIIDARATLGSYYMQVDRFVEAKKVVDPIVNIALEHDYKRRISQIYTTIGHSIFAIEDDYSKSIEYQEKALMIAEELNDIPSLSGATLGLGLTLAFNCEFERALYYLQKALDIYEAANSLSGISNLRSIISVHVYCNQGNTDLALQNSSEARRIAEECADIWAKARAHTAYGHSCHCKGYLREAEKNLLQAVSLNEKTNSLLWGSMANLFLGDTYFVMGEYQKSQNYFDKAALLLERLRFGISEKNLPKIHSTRAQVMQGNRDVNSERLYNYANENRIRCYDGRIARYVSEILLNIDEQDISQAEEWIKKAIEADEMNGIKWHLAQDYALYAELFKRKDDLPKAMENLNKAIEILKECGAVGWVEKYEKELAELS